MISIALVLLLILGVNQVFTYTTQAVGAGEAINAGIRSSRAAQAQMSDDFAGIVANGSGGNDAASIIIASRAYYAFRNAKDQASMGTLSSSASAMVTAGTLPNAAFQDINGDGTFGDPTVNGEVIYPPTYNYRNHRLDVMSFFSRGLFHRQTGNGPPAGATAFVDGMASQEAWIWYGHLQLPDNNGTDMETDFPNNATTSTFPCMGSPSSNPNNYFGSQLVLGRMALLLQQCQPGYPNLNQLSDGTAAQWCIGETSSDQALYFPSCDLSPLQSNAAMYKAGASQLVYPEVPNGYSLCDSRVDLGCNNIYNFQKQLSIYLKEYSLPNPNAQWWDFMMSGNQMFYSQISTLGWTRFKCNPFIAKPMSPRGMAQASPYFLGGCSQFIVEYAGDFLTQENDPSRVNHGTSPNFHNKYGEITAQAPDGQLDFYLDANQLKHTIWYGMPRSTTGTATICCKNGDVVPLRDWLLTAVTKASNTVAPVANPLPNAVFEKVYPTYQSINYSNGNMSMAEANSGYTCAFGPGDPAPKLIRITITLDDPTGRLPDGLTYQYVFAVPAP